MTCGKIRYPTLEQAEAALLDCRLRRMFRGRNRRKEKRVYACRDCGGFHLTAQQGVQV